jgi:hypothetical protein
MVIAGIDPDPAKAQQLKEWATAYWKAVHPYDLAGAYPTWRPSSLVRASRSSRGESGLTRSLNMSAQARSWARFRPSASGNEGPLGIDLARSSKPSRNGRCLRIPDSGSRRISLKNPDIEPPRGSRFRPRRVISTESPAAGRMGGSHAAKPVGPPNPQGKFRRGCQRASKL